MTTVTLGIMAKYGAQGYRMLVDSAVGCVDEIITAVDVEPEAGIRDYRRDVVRALDHPLDKDFGGQMNFLINEATSDWFMLLDTDENLPKWLWPHVRFLADSTPEDAINFPLHTNIVGISDFLNWPDYHIRMHRRVDRIRWEREVHPVPVGIQSIRTLPSDDRYAIQHVKTVEMQQRSERSYAT